MQNSTSEIDYFVSVGSTTRIEEMLENHPVSFIFNIYHMYFYVFRVVPTLQLRYTFKKLILYTSLCVMFVNRVVCIFYRLVLMNFIVSIVSFTDVSR